MARQFSALAVLGVLAGLAAPQIAAAQTRDGMPPKQVTTTSPEEVTPLEKARREEWRRAIARIPQPTEGCSQAKYPELEWKQVPCVTPPALPYPPRLGRRPQVVGNGTDYAADPTNVISSAEGSFDSVTGVTSETGTSFSGGGCSNPTPGVANVYSLQLNTDPFTTSVCGASPNPGCRGWQQFIYTQAHGAIAFTQYWLLNYNTACPPGWTTFPTSTGNHPGGTVTALPRSALNPLGIWADCV
jgi:hypothetical protein